MREQNRVRTKFNGGQTLNDLLGGALGLGEYSHNDQHAWHAHAQQRDEDERREDPDVHENDEDERIVPQRRSGRAAILRAKHPHLPDNPPRKHVERHDLAKLCRLATRDTFEGKK